MRRQDGFTLPEVLVAATVGIVILLGAFSLIETAAPLTYKTTDTVDATQRGRAALDQMTGQLRSQVCMSATVPPVISADSNEIIFYANTGDENAVPDKRRLAFINGNTIVEQTWKGTGAPPNTTYSASSQRTLVANAQAISSPATPVFQYYGFNASNPAAPSVLLTAPVTGTNLTKIVKVAVNFVVRPDRAKTVSKRELTFQGSAYVRTADPSDPALGPKC